MSICMDLFLLSVRGFLASCHNILWATGASPQTPPGLCCWTLLRDFRPETPCVCPSQTKFLDPPLRVVSVTAERLVV